MNKDHRSFQVAHGISTPRQSIELPSATSAYVTPKPGPRHVSIAVTDRLSRVDSLHVIPVLNSVLPVRLYVAAPLTELPSPLFPYLFATAQMRSISAGTVLVDAEANRQEYLAVMEGDIEVQREEISLGDRDELHVDRLTKSAGRQAIILLHTIPRRSTVHALSAARVIQLDSARVEALRGWMLRCDARRKPGRFRC